jgi:RHS repeat-associated protein
MIDTYHYDAESRKFTGKERDSESNLDMFGARYYASSMGRFMTPDAFYKDSHAGDHKAGTSTPTLATIHCGTTLS